MRVHLRLVLLGVSVWTTAVLAAEDPMSHLFRQNVYTPIPDHRTDIVPGMLLIVNYAAGTYEINDLEDDARALDLAPPYTAQLNRTSKVTIQGGGLATTGLKTLVGFDPSISFKKDSTYTFSGVHFGMQKLRSQDATRLIVRPGATQDAARAAYQSGGVDVFLVTDVGVTDSATVTSNTEFSIEAGTAPADLKACTAAPPRTPANPPSGSNQGGGTPPVTSGTPPNQPSDDPATVKPKTVDQLQAKDKAVGDKAKTAGAATGTDLGGNLYYCRGVDGSVVFTNPTPVQTVMKVKRVIFTAWDAPPVFRSGDFTVPLNDIHQCKRVFDSHDGCYDPPRQ